MTPTEPSNPFAAPSAQLEDARRAAGAHLLVDPRVVPAGDAVAWLKTGWAMFQQAPGPWIGILVLYVVILVVVSVLPIIGILNAALAPIFAAGIIFACEAQHGGSAPTVAHLFEGFQRNTGNLVLVGVLYLVGVVALTLVLAGGGVAAMVPLIALGGDGGDAVATPATIGLLLAIGLGAVLLGIPLGLSMWYSPALVAVHDMASFEAMKRSLFACLRNWRALLVYTLLAFAICLVAVIPLGLGLLVAGPVLTIGWWAGYRGIFLE